MLTPSHARRLLVAFALIIPVWGYVAWRSTALYMLGRERIATFRPTRVAVIEVGVDERKNVLGIRYWAPRLRYAVPTRQGSYIARQVTPLDEASSESWAREIASRYTVGRVTEGYVAPDSSRVSFLVPELGYFWHVVMGVGVVLFAAFGWTWQRSRRA